MEATTVELTIPVEAETIAGVIRDNESFLVIGHLRPDGDCLGSCLGLAAGLQQLGKQVRVYTAGPVPSVFSYLSGIEQVETELPDQADFDAVLCVDTADAHRVHPGYEPPDHAYVIDHHISNTHFGKVNWVDGGSPAAAEMVYRLLIALGVDISPEIATALFTGIATDTGSFRFSNTNEATFRMAADLVSRGANAAQIAEIVWGSRKPSAVKLGALVMSTINYEFDGRFAWNEVTQQMLKMAGGEEAELEGVSGDMRGIKGVQVAVLFAETADGQCRIGFRSKGLVNVSTMAQLLGGGGHKNASGATLAENYLVARQRALQIMRDFLAREFGE